MDASSPREPREQGLMGENVPGVLSYHPPRSEPIPLVLDSPHSGQAYPDDFRPIAPMSLVRKAEDTHVGALFADAPDYGAPLLEAHFPRSYIDPNRSLADLDPSVLSEPWPEPIAVTEKSRAGTGLVWRVTPTGTPLYDRGLTEAAVRHRIETYYRPYHERLEAMLADTEERFGRVWHLNCHSMPRFGSDFAPDRGQRRADFVLGDRDGTTCERGFTEAAREILERCGYRVALNLPYKGVEIVRLHGRPMAGRHSLQIEICRDLYMNEATLERNEGFATLVVNLNRLISGLGDYVRANCG